jgi:hypothetical protein
VPNGVDAVFPHLHGLGREKFMLRSIGIARSRAVRWLSAAEGAGVPLAHVQLGFGAADKPRVAAIDPNGKPT